MNHADEHKDFDRLINERYAGHESAPPDQLWAAIDAEVVATENGGFDALMKESFSNHAASPPAYLGKKVLISAALSKKAIVAYIASKWATASLVTLTAAIGTTVYVQQQELSEQLYEVRLEEEHNYEQLKSNCSLDPIAQNKEELPYLSQAVIGFPIQVEKKDISAPATLNRDYTSDQQQQLTVKASPENSIADELGGEHPTLIQNEGEAFSGQLEQKKKVKPTQEKAVPVDSERKTIATSITPKEPDAARSLEEQSTSEAAQQAQAVIDAIEASMSEEKQDKSLAEKDREKNVQEEQKELKAISSEPKEKAVEQAKQTNDSIQYTAIEKHKVGEVVHPANRKWFSITPYVGPAFAHRNIRTKDAEVAQFYNEHQRIDWQWNVGVSAGMHFSDRFSLQMGLSMSQLQQDIGLERLRPEETPTIQFDAVAQQISVFSSIREVRWINLNEFEFLNPQSDSIQSMDQSNYYSFSFREEQTFRSIQLPISAQYMLGDKDDKLRLLFDAGGFLSYIWSQNSRVTLEMEDGLRQRLDVSNYHGINRFGFGLRTGLGFSYQMPNNASLIVLPSLHYRLNNLNRFDANRVLLYDMRLSIGWRVEF